MSEDKAVFPWPPYYGHFQFFEKRIGQHRKVQRLEALGNGFYNLTDKLGATLRVFVCECYSFGAAEYLETTGALGNVDVIVINSMWCGYTAEAKRLCRADKVGLFKIGDFMAALNRTNLWDYLNESELETFKKNGWL